MSEKQTELVMRLRRQGKTLKEMGDALGVSRQRVWSIIHPGRSIVVPPQVHAALKSAAKRARVTMGALASDAIERALGKPAV
jgi:hypothetical protein